MPDDATKQCSKCGNVKPLDQFTRDRAKRDGHRNSCRDCEHERDRQRYQADREAKLGYQKRYYQEHTAERLGYAWLYREDNSERVKGRERRYYEGLRAAVYNHYGYVCACPGCGATEDLTIDHVNGDGASHRLELFGRAQSNGGGSRWYRWLIGQGFPSDYQTLCRPCNASKWRGVRCRLDHAQNEA